LNLILPLPRCFQKNAGTFVGKLRSNFVGTEYILYGDGEAPKVKGSSPGKNQFNPDENIREEMLAIKFTKPGNAPRRMTAVIPGIDPGNNMKRQIFHSKPYTSLMAYAKGDEPLRSPDGQGISVNR
jgi:hypothetical protein